MLTWSDTFTDPAGSPPDPSSWTTYTNGNGNGNGELQYYAPNAVTCDGSGLVITAQRSTSYQSLYPGSQFVSGKVSTKGKVEFQYGHLVVNATLPCAGLPGAWPAIWMLGADNSFVTWPQCGEIDVMESFGSRASKAAIASALHTGQDVSVPYTLPAANDLTKPHNYELMWQPGSISFAVDGHVYRTLTPDDVTPWLFEQPFFLILNLAIGGTMGGVVPAAAAFPYTMKVNSVHLYDAMMNH